MSYLRGFLPWIGFLVFSQVGWQWGALAAAVIAAATLVADRRAGTSWDGQILAIGALAFFAALTPVAFAAPHAALAAYCGAMADGWLAVVAWAGILLGAPFTLGIAKREAPEEVWDLPMFRNLNVVITSVWAGAFTVSAVASVLLVDSSGMVRGIATAIAFIAPIVFTKRYVAAVQARHADGGTAVDAEIAYAA
ncbi:hypothetical protein ACQ7HM_06780 [Williamsia sp. MIQD14]|uniref:hypothetical protein n=1 Tax=Williamsia sp. MIQD14 TaxID=3425703 RepID=UPI003DA0BB66